MSPTRRAGRRVLGLSLLVFTFCATYAMGRDLPYSRVSTELEHVERAVRFGGTRDFNPRHFIHPPLFSYVLCGVYGLMYLVGRATGWVPSLQAYERLFFVDPTVFLLAARWVTLGFGIASLVVCYRLARRLFDERVASWTVAFLAIAPVMVTWTHYGSADVPTLWASVMACAFVVGILETGSWKSYLGAGFWIGLAAAMKYHTILLGPSLVAAHILRGRQEQVGWWSILRSPRWMAGCACVAVGFALGCPYALVDSHAFLASFSEQVHRFSTTSYHFASWRNDRPGWWYIPTVVLPFGLSASVTGLCLAGLAYSAWRRTPVDVLLLVMGLPFYLYLGTWSVVKPRHLLPVVPLIVMAGMRLLRDVLDRAAPRLRPGLIGLALCGVALMPWRQTWRFNRQIAQPPLTTQAKRWVETHLPSGTSIAMLPGVPLAPNRAAIERQLSRIQARGHEGVRLTRLLRYVDDFPTTYNVYELPFPWRDDFDVADFEFSRLQQAGVEYVMTTTHVRDYLADPARYTAQVAFYHDVQRHCELIKHFQGDRPLIDVGFPYEEEVSVYACRSGGVG